MKRLSLEGALWLNRRELAEPKYAMLHNAFVGYNGIFEHFQIGTNSIREIQTFSWENSNESCDERQYNKREFRTKSREYIYELARMDGSIHFQLYFCRKRIDKKVECSIFVKILSKTLRFEYVTTEMDIICYCDRNVHRSLMQKQKLSPRGPRSKGIVVFRSNNVNAKSSISWKFAIKMEPRRWTELEDPVLGHDTVLVDAHDAVLKEQYDELREKNEALQNKYDTLEESMREFIEKNKKTVMELEEMRMELKDIKMGKDEETKRLPEQLKQNILKFTTSPSWRNINKKFF